MFRTTCIAIVIVLMGSSVIQAQNQLENIIDPGRLPYLKESRLLQISSYDTTGGNNDRLHLDAGETATIATLEGPGVITQLWCTIDSRDPHFLRRIVIRMYWDGEDEPSVEVPIGDFFGNGFEYKHYTAQYLGMSSGGYYSYFPMPFDKQARITIENQTGRELHAFYYHVDYHKLTEPLDDDVAYFHATWNRELRTSPDSNYTVLDAEGRGHYVGTNMQMQSYDGSLFYLEGDEMVYVDGEEFPSIYGTGNEDYFNSGWYFRQGEFAGPYHGLTLKDPDNGRISVYRHHISDAIPFSKSIRFTIESGHANEEMADFSSTAYWYQKEPHKPFDPMPRANMRIPLRVTVPNGAREAEAVNPAGIKQYRVQDMRQFGPDWSGQQQLQIDGGHSGKTFELHIPVDEDNYTGSLYYTTGPDYANAIIYHRGKEVARLYGYSPSISPAGSAELDTMQVIDGTIPLTFEITGKANASSGYKVGLDAFALEPVREWIPRWNIIGPFPNPRNADNKRLGLTTSYPPEQQIDLDATYEGAEGQPIGWNTVETPENGYFSLTGLIQPYELAVTYAQVWIHSSEEQTLPLLLGSDDGVKVFLNGETVHIQDLYVRIAEADQDRVPLHLDKGWNSLMIKIENGFGGYAFLARILDTDDTLRYRTSAR